MGSTNVLDHVENPFIVKEPDVVVGNGDVLKGDFFGVFEKSIRSPHFLQPGCRQQSITGRHVLW